MTAFGTARTALFEALLPVFDEPIAGFAFAGRIFRTPPVKVPAPCVFIDATSGSRATTRNGADMYVVTFPVYVTYDGAQQAQVDGLDDVLTRVIGASMRPGGSPTGHSTGDLPVGSTASPTTRAAVVSVDVVVAASTLCLPAVHQETHRG